MQYKDLRRCTIDGSTPARFHQWLTSPGPLMAIVETSDGVITPVFHHRLRFVHDYTEAVPSNNSRSDMLLTWDEVVASVEKPVWLVIPEPSPGMHTMRPTQKWVIPDKAMTITSDEIEVILIGNYLYYKKDYGVYWMMYQNAPDESPKHVSWI